MAGAIGSELKSSDSSPAGSGSMNSSSSTMISSSYWTGGFASCLGFDSEREGEGEGEGERDGEGKRERAGGRVMAKGICSYSAEELRRVMGMKSSAVQAVLPRATEEAVHRDYMVLA
jgi:hypothetical protein